MIMHILYLSCGCVIASPVNNPVMVTRHDRKCLRCGTFLATIIATETREVNTA